jgi:hypothetical protein
MRTGRSTSYVGLPAIAAAVPTNGQGESSPRSEAQERLDVLLQEQNRLSEDVTPQGEAEYRRVIAAIAQVQSEIDAARRVETQNA